MTLSLLLCRPGTHDPAGELVARVEGASGDVCHIAVTTDQDGGAWCVEAASGWVRAIPSDRYGGVQRVPLHLTDAQAIAGWQWLRARVGVWRYDALQIGADLLNLTTGQHIVSPFHRHACVCSGLAAEMLASLGIVPWAPADPATVTPQQIADWSLSQDAKPAPVATYAAAKLDRDMTHA